MPTLSSILVQRGAASMRAVEDAIARQVFHGGDLATNLLELAALREEILVPLVGESFGLEPAPPGRLTAPSPDVLRLVPGDLALRHGMFPLGLRDRALVVAVAEPLPAAVEDDLGFALDVAIRQLVAPLVRVRQAIADSYGIPLDRRYLRLVAKLDGKADPSPSAAPPPDRDALPPMRMPRPVSIPSPSFGTGLTDPEPSRLGEVPPSKTAPVAAPSGFAFPQIPKTPALPSEPEPEPEPADAAPSEPPPVQPAPVPIPKGAARAIAGVLQQALRAERVDKTRQDSSARASSAKQAKAPPLWQSGKLRHKGPFTTAMAEEELEQAATTEAVLGILFAFGNQFFAFAALFVVHGDVAEGRDASGPGAGREAVAALRVPLDEPGALALARDRRGPVIGKLAAEGRDAQLAADLGRGPRSPARAVALLPVVVRGRAVAVLYGDDGDADVELSSIGDVVSMVGLAGSALERIALRKKLGARAPEVPHKVKIQDGAVALARAISVSAMAAVAPAAPPEPLPPAPPPPPPAPPPPAPPAAEPAFIAIDPTEIPVPPEAPAVAMFSTTEPEAAPSRPSSSGGVEDLPSFAVSPPELEPPLVVSPGPRTARYFDEPAEPKRPTDPGLGIPFPEDGAPHDAPEAQPTLPMWGAPPTERELPPHERPTMQMERPVLRPTPGKRGPAPLYEGRSGVVPDTASVEWVGAEAREDAAAAKPRIIARTLPSMGFSPLPSTPPPNATAWTSFPSPPPPPAIGALAKPARSERPAPIPREDGVEVHHPRFATMPVPTIPSATSHSASHPPAAANTSDLGSDLDDLIHRVAEGGHRGQEAFDHLVRHGEQLIAQIMARFPGPLRVDRHRARAELPPASQCGPVLELVAAIRRPALPFVSSRSISTDTEVRFWATHVLGELRYPEAASVLVPRLFDDDATVRRIARRSAAALVTAGAPGAPILKGLEDITKNPDEASPHRVLAIETMGEIRSGSMVPPLLSALDGAPEEVADAARRALLLITRQDFGRDARRWHEWWNLNAGRHRIEWLIDALMHDQPGVRRAAGDELKLLTKEYFGYYDDLPRRERERAQGLYRAWWDREGRFRF